MGKALALLVRCKYVVQRTKDGRGHKVEVNVCTFGYLINTRGQVGA